MKFLFFARSCPDLSTPFVEEAVFTSFYVSSPICEILIVHRDMGLFLGSLYVFLGEVSVQVLCPFFNCIVCLPGVESYEIFIYIRDQTFV